MSDTHSSSTSSFQRVARDVMDLLDLQMQLISVDSQAAKQKLIKATVCGGTAAVLGGSALTVLMFALGYLLAQYTALSVGGGILVVSLVFFLIVGLLGWMALQAIQSAAEAMSETKSEFAENLRWLKATLISPSTSARNQLRRESFPDPETTSYGDRSDTYPFDRFTQAPLSER